MHGKDIIEGTFKKMYLNNEIEFEDIDDFVYEWGIRDLDMSLKDFLGIDEVEEDAYVTIGEEELLKLLDKQKTNS